MFGGKKKAKVDIDVTVHHVEGPKLLDIFQDLHIELKCGKEKAVSKSVKEGASAKCEFVEQSVPDHKPENPKNYRLSRTGDVICRVTYARDSLHFRLSPSFSTKDLKLDPLPAKFKFKTSKEKITSVEFPISQFCYSTPYKKDFTLKTNGKSELTVFLTLSITPGGSAKLLPPAPSHSIAEGTEVIAEEDGSDKESHEDEDDHENEVEPSPRGAVDDTPRATPTEATEASTPNAEVPSEAPVAQSPVTEPHQHQASDSAQTEPSVDPVAADQPESIPAASEPATDLTPETTEHVAPTPVPTHTPTTEAATSEPVTDLAPETTESTASVPEDIDVSLASEPTPTSEPVTDSTTKTAEPEDSVPADHVEPSMPEPTTSESVPEIASAVLESTTAPEATEPVVESSIEPLPSVNTVLSASEPTAESPTESHQPTTPESTVPQPVPEPVAAVSSPEPEPATETTHEAPEVSPSTGESTPKTEPTPVVQAELNPVQVSEPSHVETPASPAEPSKVAALETPGSADSDVPPVRKSIRDLGANLFPAGAPLLSPGSNVSSGARKSIRDLQGILFAGGAPVSPSAPAPSNHPKPDSTHEDSRKESNHLEAPVNTPQSLGRRSVKDLSSSLGGMFGGNIMLGGGGFPGRQPIRPIDPPIAEPIKLEDMPASGRNRGPSGRRLPSRARASILSSIDDDDDLIDTAPRSAKRPSGPVAPQAPVFAEPSVVPTRLSKDEFSETSNTDTASPALSSSPTPSPSPSPAPSPLSSAQSPPVHVEDAPVISAKSSIKERMAALDFPSKGPIPHHPTTTSHSHLPSHVHTSSPSTSTSPAPSPLQLTPEAPLPSVTSADHTDIDRPVNTDALAPPSVKQLRASLNFLPMMMPGMGRGRSIAKPAASAIDETPENEGGA